MQAERGASIHLDIPFYRQHFDFTCGPACLMMAMKYRDHNLRLGNDLEIDIWREGNLVAVPGTSRFGLAYSAAVRGFSARVTSNTGGLDFVDKINLPLNEPDMEILRDMFHVPVIVTNTRFFSNEDLPHWIAVTGIDDKFMYFNNPSDANHRKRKTGLPALQEFVGYHGAQSMVEVWKQ
jgi:predicted double-glycine peptidase